MFSLVDGGYTDSRSRAISKIHRMSVKHARGGAKEDAVTLAASNTAWR